MDDPAMLAADGVHSLVACLALSSPGGSIKIGALTLPTPKSDTQFGLVVENPEEIGEQVFKVVSPTGGATSMAPIVIPNGLPALVCPGASHELRWICGGHPGNFRGDSQLANVSVSVQQAGELSNFNLTFVAGYPLITDPVKIHLQNELLGPHCYIGSDSEPIELHLENLTEITSLEGGTFSADGTPVTENAAFELLEVSGATSGDESFAVPVTSGCGERGTLDAAIDHNAGLPSPAGSNALRLNETSSSIALPLEPASLAPNEGRFVSEAWHSAVLGGHQGHQHH